MQPFVARVGKDPRVRRLAMRAAAGGVVAVVAASLGVIAVLTGIATEDASQANAASCAWSDGGVITSGLTVAELDAEQLRTATAIIGVAKGLGAPAQGWIVALATALQESGLRPLPYGDPAGPDSIGPFQQRAAWGSYSDRLDPASSARMFFVGGQAGQPGLLSIPGWEQLPVTVAAQAVQVSAFPDAYAKHVPLARALVEQIGGVAAPITCAGEAATMFAGFALPIPSMDVHPPLADHWDHRPAVDLPASTGTPVYAVAGGAVSFTQDGNDCGLGISIADPAGGLWTYCHLSARVVQAGSAVLAGQQIGLVGTTGESSGPHLHLQLALGGTLVCPQTLLDAIVLQQPPPALTALPRTGPCA